MLKHYNIRIFGDVVGVNFRLYAREKASELGVTGFARNESDGTVFIEAEGSDEALDRFVEWCRVGPKHARVDRVEVSERELKGYNDFQRA
ncbi:MAG: acylphosphatase [Candidatus Doudnabacteria bacterium]|nr:acylphosphatase [Candidatus Doudnabacteria bacterium]